MKIRVSQNRINSILSVVVSTYDWSNHELDMIVKLGEPKIQIGGEFKKACIPCMLPPCPDHSNDYPDWCTFELPEAEKGVRSEFPVMVEFGSDDFDDPELCAKSWSDEIVRRIARAVKVLRRQTLDLVREETYEV